VLLRIATISACWAFASGDPLPPRPVGRVASFSGVEPDLFGSLGSAPPSSSARTAPLQRVRTARWRGATPLVSVAFGSAPAAMSAAITAACAAGFQESEPGLPSAA
jgi:hypothetical protein